MRTRLLGVIAVLGLASCDNAQSGGGQSGATLTTTCVSNVVNMLSMLHTMNNNGQNPPAELGQRFGQAARTQCECAQKALTIEEFAGLNPEVTTTQQDLSNVLVSLQESGASQKAPEWRDKVNAALQQKCPAIPM
jgi:hypothetical protein